MSSDPTILDRHRRLPEMIRSEGATSARPGQFGRLAACANGAAWLLGEVDRLRALIDELALEHAETIDGEWGCCHNKTEIRSGIVPPDFEGDEATTLTAEACPGREAYLKHAEKTT
jgi:hypothetical protein